MTDATIPVYFRPREFPNYAYFPVDTFLKRNPENIEEAKFMERMVPKSTVIPDATKGVLFPDVRTSFATIYSSDEIAYILINDTIIVEVGNSIFTIPTGRFSYHAKLMLFHRGPVTIEHREIDSEKESKLESIQVNIKLGQDRYLIMSRGYMTEDDVAVPPEVPDFDHNTKDSVSVLKRAGIIHYKP